MFKLDIEPISHKLKNNRDAHEDYLKKTREHTDTIHGLVERARKQNPSEPLLDSACKFTKHVQESFVYVSKTCPSLPKPSEKLVAVTPMNKVKKRLKSSNSASRSQPTANKKNDKISQTPSSNMKNKVEAHPRRVNLNSNKMNYVKEPICDAHVKHTMLNANSELICVKCRIANNSKPNHSWGSNATDVPLLLLLSKTGTVRFRNDQIAKIMGYGDYQLGNVTISRNLEGVDLLLGSRDTNLYIISLNDMPKTSPICLLSKASKTKSWLWHCRLSHLNFSTLNKLAKDDLARGIPKLKFKKDHLCSACALGKSKKSSHQPKAEDTN
ncbi:retrovirus-related pol polyprotein from transposon TNT 1-94 [Tanacetum coccineum]